MLQIENLSVLRGRIQALWNVTIEVMKGEVVALLGANGAGKTTLLESIMGWLPLSGGEIRYKGALINGLPPHRIVEKGISITPEGRGLFPTMNVLENLELGAYPKATRNFSKQNIDRVFEIFPALEDKKNQIAGSLSGGQQQMLAVAKSIMSNPELILLDEPSSGLAPKTITELFNHIKKLHEKGLSFLLVEQNMRQAMKIADRIYVIQTGRIVYQGMKDEATDSSIYKAYMGIA